jgi:hypothetical protein
MNYYLEYRKRSNNPVKKQQITNGIDSVCNKIFQSFLRKYFEKVNLGRLRTFEKFSFSSIERDSGAFRTNLAEIRGEEPVGTLHIPDLWSDTQRVHCLKMANFDNDKRNFIKYLHLMQASGKVQKQPGLGDAKGLHKLKGVDPKVADIRDQQRARMIEEESKRRDEKRRDILDRLKSRGVKIKRRLSILEVEKTYESLESKIGTYGSLALYKNLTNLTSKSPHVSYGNHEKHANKEQSLSNNNSDRDLLKNQTRFAGSFMAPHQSPRMDPFGKATLSFPSNTNKSTFESAEPVIQNLQHAPTRKGRVVVGGAQTTKRSNFADGQQPSYGTYR